MSRDSSLFLLLPIRIVALGIVYVGINDLLGLGYVLNSLGCYGLNGLIAVVERYESRGNSRLVILSLVCSVISRGGEFLLHLGSTSYGLFLGSIVSVYVTVDNLLGSVCISLSRLLCRSIVLSLLLLSRGNRKECLALCLLLSPCLLLIELLLRCVLISGGREFLLSLRCGSYSLLGRIVSVNVAVNDLGSLLNGLILQGLLSRDLSCLLLTVDECESLTLSLLISLRASSCLVCVDIFVALGVRNLGSLIIVEGISLDVSICGCNDAYSVLFVIAVLGNEQYYLLILIISVVIIIRAGSGIFTLVIGIRIGSVLVSLDHDCRLLNLIALSSSELLKSLSLRLVSSKKLCSLFNAGVAPLSLEFLFKLLSRLDSKDVVASHSSASCLLSLCLLEKCLCLLNAGINLLFLLGLFKLLSLYSLKLVSLFLSLLSRRGLLALLISLVLSKKRLRLVLRIIGTLFSFFYKRAVFGHGLELADVKIYTKLSCHKGVLLLVGGNVCLRHSVSKVKITVNSVGCGYSIGKIDIAIDTAVAY